MGPPRMQGHILWWCESFMVWWERVLTVIVPRRSQMCPEMKTTNLDKMQTQQPHRGSGKVCWELILEGCGSNEAKSYWLALACSWPQKKWPLMTPWVNLLPSWTRPFFRPPAWPLPSQYLSLSFPNIWETHSYQISSFLHWPSFLYLFMPSFLYLNLVLRF